MNRKKIYLCAICNVQSGTCNEDCKFCTQSVKYKANIQRYKEKSLDDIIKEAKIAVSNKAIGYCLVTAGAGLDDKKVEFIAKIAKSIKKEISDLNLIACNGIASLDHLKELKKAGINSYNHNLETSKEFYPTICTTHSWEDRYQTCLNIKSANLNLCSGGIFGMGEAQEDRISMLNSIKELNPQSMPINFFHPNDALPLTKNTLDKQEALDLIKLSRETLGKDIMIMVAGGRESTLKDDQYKVFEYGANSIVIGNYLTTNGKIASKELEDLEKLNFDIASTCN